MSSQVQSSPRLRPFKPVRFGRYTLLMPISTGGMGEIYLARLEGAQGFEKLCVIKKILPHLAEDADFVERFVNEARILVKLSHGNIAQVLDMGVHEAAPYIALEFVDGKDLRRIAARMRDRKLPIPLSFVLYTMMRVLDALAYAHRKRDDNEKDLNLVHRDVSPQNVLISYEGEVKVIDFGLAKSTLSSTKTNPSIILGKFLYMSPEQARHQRVDRRSDLYAVGLVLYELVAGKNPFDDIAPGELMAKVATPSVAALAQVEPLCPATLADVVMKALSPDPAQRFQTAEELRARLQAILLEIDPNAGPETSTRFMREAFAVEYHAERKMLTALREQARQLVDEAPDEDEAVPDRQAAPPPAAAPLRALGGEPTPAPPASFSFGELPNVEQLSFQPTRKAGMAVHLDGAATPEDFERETLPSIHLGAVATAPTQPLPPARAPEPPPPPPASRPMTPIPVTTEPASPTPRTLELVPSPPVPGEVPSVLVDGLEKHSLPSPEGRLRTLPEVAAHIPASELPPRPARAGPKPEGQPARRVGKSGLMKAPSVKRSGESLKVERPEGRRDSLPKPAAAPSAGDAELKPEPKKIDRSATPLDTPALQTAPAPVSASKRSSSVLVWLVIPLVALLAVGAYIAWDVYTESVKQRQLAEEDAREAVPEPPPPDEHRTREVRVGDQGMEPLPPSPEPPKKDKPKDKPRPPKAPVAVSAGHRALNLLSADFERIGDQAAQGKFKLRVIRLRDEVARAPDAAETLKKIAELHGEIRAELAKDP